MSTALYRRYRPDTFADVIGQEHVTAPLMTALEKDAVSHAYLFSGPRGCGKTTSARILARCLNCAQGPTPTPCGSCESCRDLATGGPGSLDVIEIDAASHGGVDDARDLRERATFAPVRDRYKIFIIDEAHMVTAAGFNALLKIVEEPPEHIKFIFATTEPDKVIGTIRSRTHHYPFRLVPPEPLLDYLDRLCQEEGVGVALGVLPLVLRAGGGSVRDTLSVLDQLIAGSSAEGIDYERAVALLGFTHSALLDDVVASLAAREGAKAFDVVDRVVQSGQDPRRFVEDLLERMRDLIIVKAVPENPEAILRGVPTDQITRMQEQASTVGSGELSRSADVTAQALTDMVGATSPRLHLELLMARLLLPHADQGTSSLAARLDQLERRLDFLSGSGAEPQAPAETAAQPPAESSQASTPTSAPVSTATSAPVSTATSAPRSPAPTPAAAPSSAADDWAAPGVSRGAAEEPEAPQAAAEHSATERLAAERPTTATEQSPVPAPSAAPAAAATAAATSTETPVAQQATSSDSSRADMMQRAWPDVVHALASQSRLLWMLVKDNASVAGFDGQTLTLSFTNDGARNTFASRNGEQALGAAIHQVLGMSVSFDLITGGAPPAAGRGPKGPSRPTPAPQPSQSPSEQSPEHQVPGPQGEVSQSPRDQEEPAWVHEETPEEQPPPPDEPPPEDPHDLPPSAHPAWDGDPSTDPAGTVEDEPDQAQDAEPSAEPDAYRHAATAPKVPVFARPSPTAPAPAPAPAATTQPAAAPSSPQTTDASQHTPPRHAAIRERMARRQPASPGEQPLPPPDPFGTPRPPEDAEQAEVRPEAHPETHPSTHRTSHPTAHTDARPETPPENPAGEPAEDVPSDDDITVEDSAVFGRKAVERLLDGTLIEERSLSGGPL